MDKIRPTQPNREKGSPLNKKKGAIEKLKEIFTKKK